MISEIYDSLQDTIKHHLFDTAEQLGTVLEEKYNINKEDIKFEYINGGRELTIKIPGKIESMPIKITILGEEVVNG